MYAVAGVKSTREDGIAEERIEFDGQGNVTKISNKFGLDSKPTANKDGVFEERTEYGPDGKEKKKSLMYAVAGVKSTREDGIAEERVEFDGQGNVTKMSYFDIDGNPMANKNGIFEVRIEHGPDGKKKKWSLMYAVDVFRVSREDGIAEERVEFDGQGKVTKTSYFDIDGNPVILKEEPKNGPPSS